MIIVEGEVVKIEDDSETVIGPGESFCILKGRRCVWNQSSSAKEFFMIFDDKSTVSAGVAPASRGDDSRRREHSVTTWIRAAADRRSDGIYAGRRNETPSSVHS